MPNRQNGGENVVKGRVNEQFRKLQRDLAGRIRKFMCLGKYTYCLLYELIYTFH